MSNNFTRLLATFFYVGYMPFASGSMATILGVLLAIACAGHLFIYVSIFCVITVLGFISSGQHEKNLKIKDPSCIVIDEVSGTLLAFFMLPLEWKVILSAFFLFRAFDMFKIFPVGYFEKKEGGTGIMMDDLMAGIYTNVIMHLALKLSESLPLKLT